MTLIDSWKNRAIQNQAFDRPSLKPAEKSGKIFSGPILSGAVARVRMVATELTIWAAMRVKAMWKRVRVLSRIIPKSYYEVNTSLIWSIGEYLPTPCRASSTPSHNHKARPAKALAT
jgi:hypothetical protein